MAGSFRCDSSPGVGPWLPEPTAGPPEEKSPACWGCCLPSVRRVGVLPPPNTPQCISITSLSSSSLSPQSIGKGSLWSIDPEYRHNLIQALKKTPYHPYSPGLATPSTSPPTLPQTFHHR